MRANGVRALAASCLDRGCDHVRVLNASSNNGGRGWVIHVRAIELRCLPFSALASNSGQTQARSDCPLCARNEILRGNNEREIRRLQICINLLSANRYSITSSARPRGLSANVRLMVLIAIDRRSNYMNVRAVQRVIVLQMRHRNHRLVRSRWSQNTAYDLSCCTIFLQRVSRAGRICNKMGWIEYSGIGPADRQPVAKARSREIDQVAEMEIGDLVEAFIGRVEHELIISSAAGQRVIASAADQNVISGTAFDGVIAGETEHRVVARSAYERVGIAVADDDQNSFDALFVSLLSLTWLL